MRAAVIGLGYVGLPLVVQLAESGIDVVGIDVDQRKVDAVNKGTSYIDDVPTRILARYVKNGRIEATTDFSRLRDVQAMSICVPTPLSKMKDPDISYIVEAMNNVARYLQKGQIIVLESTTFPGTTEEVVLPMLEESGLTDMDSSRLRKYMRLAWIETNPKVY